MSCQACQTAASARKPKIEASLDTEDVHSDNMLEFSIALVGVLLLENHSFDALEAVHCKQSGGGCT